MYKWEFQESLPLPASNRIRSESSLWKLPRRKTLIKEQKSKKIKSINHPIKTFINN